MTSAKDAKQLVKQLRKQGFHCQIGPSGHWMVYKDESLLTTMGFTPSDVRAMKNNVARLRKHGFVWPPRR